MFEERRKELDGELLSEFSPWMARKMLSFYEKGKLVSYINDTINMYDNIHKCKEDQFRFYEYMIPIQKKKHVNYIKRNREDEKKESLIVPEFYSRRELELFEYYNG
jgi:hypothetical protein